MPSWNHLIFHWNTSVYFGKFQWGLNNTRPGQWPAHSRTTIRASSAHLFSGLLSAVSNKSFLSFRVPFGLNVDSNDNKSMKLTMKSWHLTPDQNQPPSLPVLPGSLGEKPQNFGVEGLHLGGGFHLHLQQVILAKFAFQVLDGTDTPGVRSIRSQQKKKKTQNAIFETLGLPLVLFWGLYC